MRNFLICFCFFIAFVQTVFAQSYKKMQDDATAECEKGNFLNAITLSEKAIALAEKDKKVSFEDLLSLKSENAAYYLLSEQVDKGLALMDPLIKEVEASDKYPKAELNIRQNYGIALLYLSYFNDALEQLNVAYELSQTVTIKPKDLNAILASMASCYQARYEFTKSEMFFLKTIELSKKENLTNTVDFAALLSSTALLYRDMLLDAKALTYYEQAEKIFVKIKDTMNTQFPVFLVEYGGFLAENNQYEKALNLTFRAKNIDKAIYTENSTEYAGTLNNLGFIYSKMNRIIECEQFYEQSIKIKKEIKFARIESYLTTISNLMIFYNKVGRKEAAKELMLELEEGMKNKTFVDTLKRATFASNLGIEYSQADEYEKAYKYFKDALFYYEAVYGKENDYQAEIYINMGTLFQVQNKYEQCAEYLNKAVIEYQKKTQEASPENINTLCNLAILLKNIDKPDLAEPILDKASDIAKKFNVTQTDLLEQLYIAEAEIQADLNHVKESMDYFNKYLKLKYAQIDQNFSYMTEDEKMFFLEEFELNIKNFYTTILNNIEKYPELIKALLDFRIKTKAFLLNNLSKIKQSVFELNDPVLNEKFEQLKLKRESISKLMSFDTNEFPYALAEASALKGEADLLEKEISLKVSGIGANTVNKKMDWQSIQKQLLPNEAAIEIFQAYLIYDKDRGKGTNYTYMIIKSSGNPVYVSIDRPIDWEQEVMTLYRNSIDMKKDDPDLYRRLWKEVDAKLQGITTLYVSPDGIYNQLNLNTLFNAESKKYVIEYEDIHLLTSLRDLNLIKSSTFKKPKTSVLIGNPTFDFDLTRLNVKANDLSNAVATRGAYGFVLSELPGTKTEVEVIKHTLESAGVASAVFMEEKANEAEVKKIKNPDVLHIATHGFFLEDPKEEDLLGYSKMEKEYYKNPMMRSGIFFSGANKTYTINTANINAISNFEDGMLTAYEAMNLSLDKTELVVLSACQTGLGKIKNGEGVYGLQRAFKLAGAKSMIMSLWPVSDDATKELMISFYASWAKSGNLYSAFKEAQLDVKKKYPEPYYWGAFILNGK